jgi:hypothetical protein
VVVVVAGIAAVATAGTLEAAGTTGTAGLTAGDCDTAFSTLTGSAGEEAATAVVGRTSSVLGADAGIWGVAGFVPLTAGDCRCWG